MSVPGFAAEISLYKTNGHYQLESNAGVYGNGVYLSVRLSNPASNCIDIHYVPRCYPPNAAFQCCDYRHERRCTDTYTRCSSPVSEASIGV
jgi:hypothetical protein